MAKSKKRTRHPQAKADPLPNAAPSGKVEPARIQPRPPQRNLPLFLLAIVLFLAWLVYLVAVAFLANRGGGGM